MASILMRRIGWVAVLLCCLCGCASSTVPDCSDIQNKPGTLHVLFIGNSYTYVNDLPTMFSQLACSGGHPVQASMAAQGGWRLEDHLASSQTMDLLASQKWDVVVLQEQSEAPAFEYNRIHSMYPAIRTLAARIKKQGAQPVLFLTWGHRDGVPDTDIKTYAEMQAQLDLGYRRIAQELNLQVVPVGDAWYRAVTQPHPLDLWQEDGIHPLPEGTYLAACVFYAALFHETPEGVEFLAGLPQDTAQTLQTLAAGTLSH